jgi:hypothetical protein
MRLLGREENRVYGLGGQQDVNASELLSAARERYEVFHIIVEQGSFASSHKKRTVDAWKQILGNRALPLKDYTKISDVILAAVQISEGADVEEVIDGSNCPDVLRHAFFTNSQE